VDSQNELLFISDRTGWWNIYREVSGKVIYHLILLLLLLLCQLGMLLMLLLWLLLLLKHPGTGHTLCQQDLHCYQLYTEWHCAWSAKQPSRLSLI